MLHLLTETSSYTGVASRVLFWLEFSASPCSSDPYSTVQRTTRRVRDRRKIRRCWEEQEGEYRTGWYGSNTVDLYLRGALFESCHGLRLHWPRLSGIWTQQNSINSSLCSHPTAQRHIITIEKVLWNDPWVGRKKRWKTGRNIKRRTTTNKKMWSHRNSGRRKVNKEDAKKTKNENEMKKEQGECNQE
jgi:hypothetical protein